MSVKSPKFSFEGGKALEAALRAIGKEATARRVAEKALMTAAEPRESMMTDFIPALRSRLTADAAVNGIVGTKIFPLAVAQNTVLPYIRYQVVSDPRPQHMKGYTAARQTLVQIDCFADTYGVSRQLAQAVVDALAEPAVTDGIRFGRGNPETTLWHRPLGAVPKEEPNGALPSPAEKQVVEKPKARKKPPALPPADDGGPI